MNGYVKNVSSEWAYAMKRAVKPGGEVSLDELYQQYGKKHDIASGEDFVDWLTKIKLKNTDKWKIVFNTNDLDDSGDDKAPTSSEEAKSKPNKYSTVTPAPIVAKGLQISDIVNLTVRAARITLPKVTDLNLLRYSLQEANQMADRDSLCRMLRKRIKELQISR